MKASVLFLLAFSSAAIAQSNRSSDLSVSKRNDSIALNNVNNIIQTAKENYSSLTDDSENRSEIQKNKIQLLQNDLNFNMRIGRRFVSQQNSDVFSSPRAATVNGLGSILRVPIYKSK